MSGGYNLADLGIPFQDHTVGRSHQGQDIAQGLCAAHGRLRGFEVGTGAIQFNRRNKLLAHQLLRPLVLRLRQTQTRLGFIHRTLQVARLHAREDLSLLHGGTFFDQHFGQSAHDFGCNRLCHRRLDGAGRVDRVDGRPAADGAEVGKEWLVFPGIDATTHGHSRQGDRDEPFLVHAFRLYAMSFLGQYRSTSFQCGHIQRLVPWKSTLSKVTEPNELLLLPMVIESIL